MNNRCCGIWMRGDRPCLACPRDLPPPPPGPLEVEHPPARLYFECHVTIDPVAEGYQAHAVDTAAGRYGFRRAKLLMEKGAPSNLDTFLTAHGQAYGDLVSRMSALIKELKGLGCPVRRAKIEDTLYDTKRGDAWPL